MLMNRSILNLSDSDINAHTRLNIPLLVIATRMHSSIIGYFPTTTTTTTTLDVRFIASRAAPAIAAAVITVSIYSACVVRVALNSAQSHLCISMIRRLQVKVTHPSTLM